MLKLAFTKTELEALLGEVPFTSMQKRIIKYRIEELSRTQMAELETVSIATIDREIKDIAIKIKKAFDSNLIVI